MRSSAADTLTRRHDMAAPAVHRRPAARSARLVKRGLADYADADAARRGQSRAAWLEETIRAHQETAMSTPTTISLNLDGTHTTIDTGARLGIDAPGLAMTVAEAAHQQLQAAIYNGLLPAFAGDALAELRAAITEVNQAVERLDDANGSIAHRRAADPIPDVPRLRWEHERADVRLRDALDGAHEMLRMLAE
jgi:hypothetical protein